VTYVSAPFPATPELVVPIRLRESWFEIEVAEPSIIVLALPVPAIFRDAFLVNVYLFFL